MRFEPFALYPLLAACLLAAPCGCALAEEKPELQWGALLDTYYSYNFNRPAQPAYGTSLPGATNAFHYYDAYHNQLSLSLAEISLRAKTGDVALTTDLDFGSFADLNANGGAGADEVAKHIGQALLSYRPRDSRFFLEAGKMYSHLGLESAKAKDNAQYSRSVLFSYGLPFWHTGARVGYDWIPDTLETSFYVYNGWNSLYDDNQSKTLGAQVRWTPVTFAVFTYNYIGGPERADSERDWRQVHELNTTWTILPQLSLGTDALYGFEPGVLLNGRPGTAHWYGGLVSLKAQLSERSYLSPRFEVFRDQDGAMLGKGAQTLDSATLTYGRRLAAALEARAEGRLDRSNRNVFVKGSGTTDTQATLLTALLLSY